MRAIVWSGALLGSNLHHALVPAGRLEHPAALADEERQRLLHIDVLARGAGQHHLQCVPVVRGGDHDGLDVLVLEHPSEIAIALGRAAQQRERFVATAAMCLGDRNEIRILLRLEIEDVALADQTVADETDAHALVRRRARAASLAAESAAAPARRNERLGSLAWLATEDECLMTSSKKARATVPAQKRQCRSVTARPRTAPGGARRLWNGRLPRIVPAGDGQFLRVPAENSTQAARPSILVGSDAQAVGTSRDAPS